PTGDLVHPAVEGHHGFLFVVHECPFAGLGWIVPGWYACCTYRLYGQHGVVSLPPCTRIHTRPTAFCPGLSLKEDRTDPGRTGGRAPWVGPSHPAEGDEHRHARSARGRTGRGPVPLPAPRHRRDMGTDQGRTPRGEGPRPLHEHVRPPRSRGDQPRT